MNKQNDISRQIHSIEEPNSLRAANLLPVVPIPTSNPKLVGFVEDDLRSRSFKLLRTTIARELPEERGAVIGITSPSPNAGKSFIACNLAASMSRIASNDVILVDLDLQRSTVSEMFALDEPPGVGDYLLGEAQTIPDIARQVEDTKLVIVPSYQRRIRSAELMAGERLSTLFSEIKSFSHEPTVICDLPPLFVSDDAMLAAQHLDGVIMVVEQGVTTKKQLEASLQMLHQTKLIGTVFNRYSGGFGDPYGYSASYSQYYR